MYIMRRHATRLHGARIIYLERRRRQASGVMRDA
jgi:hypothetical protein